MRHRPNIILLIILAISLALSPTVGAQQHEMMASDDNVLERLSYRCSDIQSSLNRLHTSDSLLRVNVAQSYNTISGKLMARLNSRLALNRIDSQELVEIASRFDIQREDFRATYRDYEIALSALLKLNCQKKPAEFYAKLIETRDLRLRLSITVRTMNSSIGEYRLAVERVRASLVEASSAK